MILSKLNRYVGALAVAGAAATSANAAVVLSGTVNLNIPSTTNGLYLNVVTGVNNLPGSTAGSTVPGWDVNPWSSSGLGLFNPAAPTGGSYVGTTANGTVALNLASGTSIGASSIFGSNSSATTAAASGFNLNSSNNLVGFRFQNEANGNQIHYGWMRIALGATLGGQTRTLVEYAYEDQAGVPILAGLPTPGAASLLGLGALAGLRRRR